MLTDDFIERHPALLQREESSWARGAHPSDLRARVSTTATESAACSEHARFLLTDCLHFVVPRSPHSNAIESALYVSHAAALRCLPPVCALYVTSRWSRVSRLSRVSSMKRTSQITRIARMPRGSRHTRGQRSTLIKWIARVSLSSRKTRVERGSRHPRTPRREKATATTDRQRGRRLRQPPGLPRHHLSVFHQPAIPPRPPTDAPASHLLSPPSRPRAQASPTLERTQLHR